MSNIDFLKNRIALVTGASGGIGRAVCCRLAGYGMTVFITGRNEEKLQGTADLIRGSGGKAVLCPGDLTDPGFPDTLVEKIKTEYGVLDVLVNNAGIAQHDLFEAVTPELFDAIMNTNVRAPYFLTQKLLPLLRSSDCATVLNIGSVVSHKGYPCQSVYAASKHAILGWSKSLANEVYKDNIRVHVISPGGVYTDLVLLTRPDLTPEGMTVPEDIAAVAGFYLEMRRSDAVIDEIQVHRPAKEPFA